MNWLSLLKFLMSLPSVISAVNKFITDMKERAAEEKHKKALDELKNAKTEQEKKDAFDKLLDNP